jgi:hypothetical protein
MKIPKGPTRGSDLAPRVLLMNGPDPLGNTVGPGPGRLRHFASRDRKRLLLVLQSRDGRKGEEPNRAPRVPFGWTAETAP